MAYFCNNCSYRSTRSGPAGECPACGSFNLTRRRVEAREKKPPGKWRLFVLAGLWSYLLGLIIWKLSH